MSAATLPPAADPVEANTPERITSVAGRMGPRWLNVLRRWFGWPWERRLARAALAVPRIRAWERKYLRLTDAEMLECGQRLRGRARGGERLNRLLAEAFGLVSVAAQRLLQLRPHDV